MADQDCTKELNSRKSHFVEGQVIGKYELEKTDKERSNKEKIK